MELLFISNDFTVFVLGSFMHLECISMIGLRQHLTFLKADSQLSEHNVSASPSFLRCSEVLLPRRVRPYGSVAPRPLVFS